MVFKIVFSILSNIINVTLLDAIPKSEVANHISLADIALINLRKSDTFKKVLPSKIFENAAMEKPILLGVEGEAQELVTSYEAGLCFEPENKKDFLEKLNAIYQNKAQLLVKVFDRKTLALEMLDVMQAMLTEVNFIRKIASQKIATTSQKKKN